MTDNGTNEPDDAPLPEGHWIHQATADAKVAQAAKSAINRPGSSEPDMEPDDKMYLGKSAR